MLSTNLELESPPQASCRNDRWTQPPNCATCRSAHKLRNLKPPFQVCTSLSANCQKPIDILLSCQVSNQISNEIAFVYFVRGLLICGLHVCGMSTQNHTSLIFNVSLWDWTFLWLRKTCKVAKICSIFAKIIAKEKC